MKPTFYCKFSTASVLLLLGLTACHPAVEDSHLTYEYQENGCTTGVQSYSSQHDFCEKLMDEKLNNYCAADLRMMDYKRHCQSDSVGPQPTPVPAPTPATKSCLNPANLPPRGKEISLDQFIDGTSGYYRLTTLSGMLAVRNGGKEVSTEISASASTDVSVDHPQVAGVVTCTEFSQSPQGKVNGAFFSPVVIKRESGALTKGFEANFYAYGKAYGGTDRVDANVADAAKMPTLEALKASVAGSGGELHIFQINSTAFQVLTTQKSTSNGTEYETRSSAIYIFQPVASAIPAPIPNPAPTPSPVISQAASKVCEGFYYASDKVDCMTKLKGKAFDDQVVEICNGFYYSSDKLDCLVKLADTTFAPEVIRTCKSNYYDADKLKCLLKFKN